MPIRVRCPCGKSYTVQDEAAGTRFECRGCGQTLAIPSPGTPPLIAVPVPPAPTRARNRPLQFTLAALAFAAFAAILTAPYDQSAPFVPTPFEEAVTPTGDPTLDLDRGWLAAFEPYCRATDRLKVDRSDAALLDVKRAKIEFHAAERRLFAPYQALIDEVAALSRPEEDEHEIPLSALGPCTLLREKGIACDFREVLEGGLFLLKRSTYPRHERNFGSYTYLYGLWREEGLSHRDTIERMLRLHKL